ncbi:hypothetical protein [Moraxella nonliquefaciens]|uniref:Uncharacterized protein n=1 Tax=Moraxella nonliquefaciens TaxID=478 RepID=A0A7T3C0U1_MORNO|nr:hypothetical protein [Moraxella nonliquefaciens]QPT45442.1 hypothetical protein I6G26_05565 [Moraxella nonliquefaciens]QQC30475.1 hypothetical protein I6H63_04355 [Moraxella nonliquefaciens]
MIKLLKGMHAMTGRGEFVFASSKDFTKPIGARTVNHGALNCMGLENISGHDLRATG